MVTGKAGENGQYSDGVSKDSPGQDRREELCHGLAHDTVETVA